MNAGYSSRLAPACCVSVCTIVNPVFAPFAKGALFSRARALPGCVMGRVTGLCGPTCQLVASPTPGDGTASCGSHSITPAREVSAGRSACLNPRHHLRHIPRPPAGVSTCSVGMVSREMRGCLRGAGRDEQRRTWKRREERGERKAEMREESREERPEARD